MSYICICKNPLSTNSINNKNVTTFPNVFTVFVIKFKPRHKQTNKELTLLILFLFDDYISALSMLHCINNLANFRKLILVNYEVPFFGI